MCDHRYYCRNDQNALYIGQTGHLSYPGDRHNNNYMPSGFHKVADQWNGLCVYTARGNGQNALCNVPSSGHSWRNPRQYNPGFMCGRVFQIYQHPIVTQLCQGKVCLGARNGQAASAYEFTKAKLSSRSGSYSERMIESCKRIGMKPV